MLRGQRTKRENKARVVGKVQNISQEREFFDKNNPSIKRVADRYRYPDPAIDSEDVEQNIWLSYLKHKDKWPEGTNHQQNIMRMAVTESIDALRSAGRRGRRYESAEDARIIFLGKRKGFEEETVEKILAGELLDKMAKDIGRTDYTEVLALSAMGYTYEEIGEMKGVDAKSIDNMLYRARRRLKKVIKNEKT